MGIAAVQRNIGVVEPLHRIELALVELHELLSVGVNYVPKRNVGVPGCQTNRGRACDHQRPSDGMLNGEAEFFFKFARNCCPWVLAGFNMPASRQPQESIFVIRQKNVFVIHYDEVRDQVLGWRCRLGCTKEFHAGVNPSQCFSKMFDLK